MLFSRISLWRSIVLMFAGTFPVLIAECALQAVGYLENIELWRGTDMRHLSSPFLFVKGLLEGSLHTRYADHYAPGALRAHIQDAAGRSSFLIACALITAMVLIRWTRPAHDAIRRAYASSPILRIPTDIEFHRSARRLDAIAAVVCATISTIFVFSHLELVVSSIPRLCIAASFSVVIAAALSTAVAGLLAVRNDARLAPAQPACYSCGYPAEGSTECSECGAALNFVRVPYLSRSTSFAALVRFPAVCLSLLAVGIVGLIIQRATSPSAKPVELTANIRIPWHSVAYITWADGDAVTFAQLNSSLATADSNSLVTPVQVVRWSSLRNETKDDLWVGLSTAFRLVDLYHPSKHNDKSIGVTVNQINALQAFASPRSIVDIRYVPLEALAATDSEFLTLIRKHLQNNGLADPTQAAAAIFKPGIAQEASASSRDVSFLSP